MLKGFTRRFKPLEILTEEQVEMIHRGTLDVLRETGIRFESKRALKIFAKNDCVVDYGEKRVRFPEALVEECLRKCPSSFRLKARDPRGDLVLGGNTIYFMSFPGLQTVNLHTWESRPATKKDYYDLVTVLDALDNLHCIGSYPYFGFEGIPPVMAIPEGVAAKIRNSTKFQWTAYQKGCEVFIIQMAKVAGTEVMGACMASPPLTYYEDAVEAAQRFTEAGFPVAIVSGCIHGASGPATIAGSLVTDNAELIAGLILVQLMKPGTRVVTNNFTFSQNMRTGSPNFGGIESSLHQVAANQIWRKYRIPKWNGAVGLSNSKRIDFQCGREKAISALLAALSGANIIQLHSGIYGELTAHPIQAILDDDTAGMIGRFIDGIEVTDETLAIELIEKVGPIPGFYLDKEHTRKWWKKEQFISKASDRMAYPDEWIQKGKKSALDYAKKRMGDILATHKVWIPLTQSQEEEIERIMREARKYYKEKGLV